MGASKGNWKTAKTPPDSLRLVLCFDSRRQPEEQYFLGKYDDDDWMDEYGNTVLYPEYWMGLPRAS